MWPTKMHRIFIYCCLPLLFLARISAIQLNGTTIFYTISLYDVTLNFSKIKTPICFQYDIWSPVKVLRMCPNSIFLHSHPICESIVIVAKTIRLQRSSKVRGFNCRLTMRILFSMKAIHPKRSRNTMTISERYSRLM